MTISRLHGSNVEAWSVKNKENMLCGLITKLEDGRFKIELMMKWIHHESTQAQAASWVRGAMTVLEA